jgi:hypothetical protein
VTNRFMAAVANDSVSYIPFGHHRPEHLIQHPATSGE